MSNYNYPKKQTKQQQLP